MTNGFLVTFWPLGTTICPKSGFKLLRASIPPTEMSQNEINFYYASSQRVRTPARYRNTSHYILYDYIIISASFDFLVNLFFNDFLKGLAGVKEEGSGF